MSSVRSAVVRVSLSECDAAERVRSRLLRNVEGVRRRRLNGRRVVDALADGERVEVSSRERVGPRRERLRVVAFPAGRPNR